MRYIITHALHTVCGANRRDSMAEKLTHALIESHMMSYIDIGHAKQCDGAVRWAWRLSPMAGHEFDRRADDDIRGGIREMQRDGSFCAYRERSGEGNEYEFRFSSAKTARDRAFAWIRENRPGIERDAVAEAKDGIAYRASM